MEWQLEVPADWAESIAAQPWRKLRDGDTVVGWSLQIPCPTCGHANAIDIFHPATLITATFKERLRLRPRRRVLAPSPFRRPVLCQCEEHHPGRPSDGHGCGRHGDVEFKIEV